MACSLNGLSLNGLSTTSGLMTTSGGRDVVKYMVKCAYPAGHSLTTKDQNNVSYTYDGALGVAPELENTNTCGVDCQERISACMLAHVNNSGMHVGIWLDSEGAIGWGQSTDYPYREGSFFGNLFPNPWKGYYCNGPDYGSAETSGRLGARSPRTCTSTRTVGTWRAPRTARLMAPTASIAATIRSSPATAGTTWCRCGVTST